MKKIFLNHTKVLLLFYLVLLVFNLSFCTAYDSFNNPFLVLNGNIKYELEGNLSGYNHSLIFERTEKGNKIILKSPNELEGFVFLKEENEYYIQFDEIKLLAEKQISFFPKFIEYILRENINEYVIPEVDGNLETKILVDNIIYTFDSNGDIKNISGKYKGIDFEYSLIKGV